MPLMLHPQVNLCSILKQRKYEGNFGQDVKQGFHVPVHDPRLCQHEEKSEEQHVRSQHGRRESPGHQSEQRGKIP
jgi:hypothetical protein